MSRMEIAEAFGVAVREERKKLGISQEKFGELVGVHRTYIGMIERGEKNITLSNIFKVSRALGLTASELLRLTEERL